MKRKFRQLAKGLLLLTMCLSLQQSPAWAEGILIEEATEETLSESEIMIFEDDAAALSEEPAEEIADEPAEKVTETPIEAEDIFLSDAEGIIIEEDIESQSAVETGMIEVIDPVEQVYINPLYRDSVSENDLNDLNMYTLSVAEDEEIKYVTVEEAADLYRENMKQRIESFQLRVLTQDSGYSALTKEIAHAGLEHTGNPTEGDYLKWQYAGWKGVLSGYKSADTYYLTFTYTLTYYTTMEQETELDGVIADVLDTLGLVNSNKTRYEKIKTIYDYICQNVTYDHENLNDSSYKLKNTAYAALINKTAVCQGYAVLFYRMALECGIDTRLIAGTGNGSAHGWNIVKLGNCYYNVDATWDSSHYSNFQKYAYFLRCTENFTNHVRDTEYETETFHGSYPMISVDYDVLHTHISAEKVIENKTEATCINTGSYESVIYCLICDTEISRDPVSIPLADHTEVIDAEKEATCTEAGMTEGSHCSVCEKVLKEQEEIPAKGHEYGDWNTTEEATYNKEGTQERSCTREDCISKEMRVIYPEGWFLKNEDWYYYENNEFVTGWILVGNTYYYMKADGIMAANQWINNYYLKADGAMAVSEWVDNNQYYVDETGLWVPGYISSGWIRDSIGWWYCNVDGSYPANCWMYIDGYWYYFWGTGYMAEGWAYIGGYWYYLEPGSGKMLTNQWIGNYYVKADGAMAVNEWVDNNRYYVDDNGEWVRRI